MASIKDLKKEVNYVLGDLIDIVSIWGITSNKLESQETNQLISQIVEVYSSFISKINNREQKRNKTYFQTLRKDFEKEVTLLVEKINALQ